MKEAIETWDVVVIGAGPAGALTACLLARKGLRVALVEKNKMPRSKVCGGCLSARGLSALEAHGLAHVAQQAWGEPWTEVLFANCERQVSIPVPKGYVLDRGRFDAGLATAAVQAGTTLLTDTTATVLNGETRDVREVEVSGRRRETRRLRTRLVVAADGLGHPSLRLLREFTSRVAANSRLGLAITPSSAQTLASDGYPQGILSMAVADEGYLGVARLANREFRIAAAIDAAFASSGVDWGAWMAGILKRCGLPAIKGLATGHVKGTIPLTRSTSQPAGERIFLLGDAAGYIEPITGEGMTWALVAAASLAPIAESAASAWEAHYATQWEQQLHLHVQRHQKLNRWLSAALQSPFCSRWLFRLTSQFPAAARPIVGRLHRPLALAQKAA